MKRGHWNFVECAWLPLVNDSATHTTHTDRAQRRTQAKTLPRTHIKLAYAHRLASAIHRKQAQPRRGPPHVPEFTVFNIVVKQVRRREGFSCSTTQTEVTPLGFIVFNQASRDNTFRVYCAQSSNQTQGNRYDTFRLLL